MDISAEPYEVESSVLRYCFDINPIISGKAKTKRR